VRATLHLPDRVHQAGGATRHIIHRGRTEIGGMCIEVAAGDGTHAAADGTRVLLDLYVSADT
jgi:hypothetical protein